MSVEIDSLDRGMVRLGSIDGAMRLYHLLENI
jgi:hypothetical protein